MKPYPQYKDSGVEWIGEVPEEWKVEKLKWLIVGKLQYGANESAILEDKTLPRYIRITDFTDDGYLKEETFKSLPEDVAKDYMLNNGDILFARSGATVGKTFQFKEYIGSACFAGYLIKATPNKQIVLSGFLYLYTKSLQYEFWRNSIFNQATIQNIGADKYAYLDVVLPPLNEQTTIADFLDRKTAEIDSIIAKKERLIELYEEEKAAVINHAVTKGLDPAAKMKDSGIEWLGEIPEHWEIKRLKHISERVTVGVVVNPSNYISDNGVPFLLGSDIEENKININSCKRCLDEVSKNILWKSRLHPGDIVVVRVGYPGIAAMITPELDGANCASMMIIGRNKKFYSQWLVYILNSQIGKWQVKIVQYGAAQKQFNISHAVDFIFPIPPISEQEEIATYLNEKLALFDNISIKFKRQIELLKEYRTALISEAVTGKIDLRHEI